MELEGEIAEIIYKNEINSYCIAVLNTTDGTEITIVGYLPFINIGDTLKLHGKMVEHQEYGEQFKVDTFEKMMPQGLDALERYLANGSIKGIGPSTAKKIIETFGEDTINVFKLEPAKLAQIKGITKEKAYEMSQSFIENWEVWQIVGFLDKFGVGPQSAETIYKKLGPNSIEEIQSNPYILVDLINKVNFNQIDKMALDIGMEYNNEKRIRSGIKHALTLATYNGHCAVIYDNLIKFVNELLGVREEEIEDVLINMKAKEELVIEDRENEEWVYLSSYYMAEKNVAEKLIKLDQCKNIKKIDIEALSHSEYYLSSMISIIEYIEKISKVDSITLSEKDIEDLKDGIFWILDSVPRAIFLCNMNLETHGVIHILKMLEVKLERLNTLTDNEEYNNYSDKVKEFFQDDFKPFLNDKVLPSMDMVLQDAKINAIIIFANNINENNALYKIGTLPKFQPFIIEILDEVVDKLQTGKDKEAFIYAEKFSHIVGLSFSVLSKVAEICSIDYSNIKIDNISLLDSINDFNSMMNNLLDAFSNEDYISIADLLEYEIKEKIENIMDYTPILEEYIERLNV